MAEMIQYKCPNCGGALEFNAESQNVKCPYCDSEFPVDVLQNAAELDETIAKEDKLDWDTNMDNTWQNGEDSGLNSYICKSCGGEIVGDDNMGASTCPFCGNPVVINGKFQGELKPDLIIPFKVDKSDAKEALRKHFEGKKLLPSIFKDENHIDEIKGLYVPFWLFDADVEGTVKYRGTKVTAWSDSRYDYVKTSYFAIMRNGNMAFEDIPVDASSKMPDDLMDSLEPFDFSEAVDFKTAYFAGYFADKYDVSVEDNLPRINTRVKHSTEDVLRETITDLYDSITVEDSYIELNNGKPKYALLPVWLLNTSWNGQKYIFAMNGQTGKFVGNLPMDKGLFKKYFAMAAGIGAAAAGIIAYIAGFLF